MASCATCPAKVDSAGLEIEEVEEKFGWTFSRVAGDFVCDCCMAEWDAENAAIGAAMTPHIQQSRVMRKLGEEAAADAIAYAVAGVLS